MKAVHSIRIVLFISQVQIGHLYFFFIFFDVALRSEFPGIPGRLLPTPSFNWTLRSAIPITSPIQTSSVPEQLIRDHAGQISVIVSLASISLSTHFSIYLFIGLESP